ncbi:MAG TPA: glycosyltransferase family 39 protein, partial [Opitutaceae bacterium]
MHVEPPSPILARLTSPWVAALLLASFYGLILLSLREKSATFDEPGHAAAGYSYWKAHDYRLDPENGNLTKRWLALPYLFGDTPFPGPTSEAWLTASAWLVSDTWFYRMGNDADALLAKGRAMAALLAVGGSVLVWAWSRRLFGPVGALFSLLLFITFPGYLANGGLMVSDIAVSFLLLAAVGAWWRLLERLSLSRVLLSSVATGALFLSKMSALALIPTVAVLVAIKLIDPRPVLATGRRELRSRGQKLLGFSCAALVQAGLVILMIWAAFGFRYSAFNPSTASASDRLDRSWRWALGYPDPVALLDRLELEPAQQQLSRQILAAHSALSYTWSDKSEAALADIRRTVLTPSQQHRLDALLAHPAGLPQRVIESMRRWRVLPEAFLYGFANVFNMEGIRASYLNGELSEDGWLGYFPFLFALKTPLLVIAVFGVALYLVVRSVTHPATPRQRWRHASDVSPLLVLLLVYWALALSSKTNIGHRHLLPVYGPLFILAGGVATWAWSATDKFRRLRLAALGLVVAVGVAEVAMHFPNYIAYFNGLLSARTAYRHVVDSSLDWGQELPATARYVREHPEKAPYFISYFGAGRPSRHGIAAIDAYSYPGGDAHERPIFRLVHDCEGADDNPKVKAFLAANPDYDRRLYFNFTAADGKPGVAFVRAPESLRLGGGTYLISATLTQPL